MVRSFVRARAALSPFAAIFALLALACVARADEPAPSTSAASNGETDDARFGRLKAEGDRALAEKRLMDAIKAYKAAREIREDPLIAGRMGLAISYFDDPRAFEAAAMMLYHAVRDAAGVSTQEKDAFFAAYKRMRKLVCKLAISTNDANARIDLGEGFKPRYSDFFTFVKRGKGEAIAKLDGREDIRKTWDCTGDQDIEIKFEFPPAETAPAKTITVVEKGKEAVKIVHVPISVENPITTSSKNRLSILFGPNVVFGVAPSPAYGLSISGAYKLGNWSAMLGARGAYAFGPIEGNTIDAFSFTGMVGPCYRERWFSVYVFGSMNIVKWIPTTPIPVDFNIPLRVMPGIGIGARGTYSLSNKIGLYGGGDVTILPSDVELELTSQDGLAQVWNGAQFLLSVSLGLELGR
ncbi:MAG: hypothetical protein IPM54_11340 [Polyangiaceae bacterium]|nr:hypothetical protein [Polyangiaceae bacterium]